MKDLFFTFDRKKEMLYPSPSGKSLILPSSLAIQATLSLTHFENLSEELMLQAYTHHLLDLQNTYILAYFPLDNQEYQCFFFPHSLLPKDCKEVFLDLFVPLHFSHSSFAMLFVYANSYAFVFYQNQKICYYKSFQELQELQISLDYLKTAFDFHTPTLFTLCFQSPPNLPYLEPYTKLYCQEDSFLFPPKTPFRLQSNFNLLKTSKTHSLKLFHTLAILVLLGIPLGFYLYQLSLSHTLSQWQENTAQLQAQSLHQEQLFQELQTLRQTLTSLQEENTKMAYTLQTTLTHNLKSHKIFEILNLAKDYQLSLLSLHFIAPHQLTLSLFTKHANAFLNFKKALPYQVFVRQNQDQVYELEISIQ